ncbi:MAG: hypothetical protein PHH91_13940 [Desulfuromonadaceae bacterium]|nr:hypothetical protein [Desulfuromonadaceae bacterium]
MDLMLDTDKQERYGIAETPLDATVLEMNNDFRARHLMDSRQDYEMTTESGEEETMSGAENLAFYYRSRAKRCYEQARKQDYTEISDYAACRLKIENVRTDPVAFGMLCDSLLAKEAEANEVLALRANATSRSRMSRVCASYRSIRSCSDSDL